ncbi:Zinc transporter protein [Giardia muris]|uniref:Zinc transporter protein n=1 Tax=Giardia muris TaxID=5742 RepID=A0A4Z1SW61_GIAMU|nr:Zinc transporter protein [Giardia muris]|eukprot:TNJ30072.1 Zinc transporter protein [Giardia muris]
MGSDCKSEPVCYTAADKLIPDPVEQKKDGRLVRMIVMLVMVATYMLAELIVGLVGNSLTLVGDSFHMLSDLISLVVGLISLRLGAKASTPHATFGYKRAETIGGLFNAAFLLSTTVFLTTEAIMKFVTREGLVQNKIDLVLWVAVGGIVINIVGMFLFHDHSHHGHSHSHSHGHHGHEHAHHEHEHEHSHAEAQQGSGDTIDVSKPAEKQLKKRGHRKRGDIAMRGVFLHVLGDLIGSIIAISSTLLQKFIHNQYIFLVDPITTLLMVIILICAALPLLKDSIRILSQTSPSNVPTDVLSDKISALPHIRGVHDLHIWAFTEDIVVAHCHVVTSSELTPDEHRRAMKAIKSIFHEANVHNVTIELEYPPDDADFEAACCYSSYGCANQHRCCKYSTRLLRVLEEREN